MKNRITHLESTVTNRGDIEKPVHTKSIMRPSYLLVGLLAGTTLFTSSAHAVSVETSSTSSSHELNVLKKRLWPSPTIPVCWEKPYGNFAKEKQWIKDALADSWEKHSLVDFVGWNTCHSASRGIRIKVGDDVWPHVQGLGTKLDGNKNGMQLSFTFKRKEFSNCQSPESRRQDCIKKIAIHEFGHALGFAHEQNREDTPDFLVPQADGSTKPCNEMDQGTDGDTPFGGWDLDSVMNYCSARWQAQLSATDIAGVQQFYGAKPWSPAGDRGKGFYVGDYNGDGKSDFFRYINQYGGAEVSLSNGATFTGFAKWSSAGDRGKGFYIGDFDGDGKDDIFRYINQYGGAEVMLSNGRGFGQPVKWTGAGDRGKGFHVGDFNGDGKDDIFRYINQYGGAEVMLSNGRGFGQPVKWTGAGNRGLGFYIGDFNGDGKDDIFRYVNQYGGAEVMLSTGSGFRHPVKWTGAGDGTHNFIIGDFNNDGKDDIARDLGALKGIEVLVSKGKAFANPQKWVQTTALYNDWHVGDFDGNGTSDMFRYVNKWGGAEVYLSERSKFTLGASPVIYNAK